MAKTIIAFKCKGCDQPAFYFPEGWDDGNIEPGAVAHSKPLGARLRTHEEEARGISYVQCALYVQSSPYNFWALNKDSERIETPLEFKPMSNEN